MPTKFDRLPKETQAKIIKALMVFEKEDLVKKLCTRLSNSDIIRMISE